MSSTTLVTERHMLNLLLKRYTSVRRGSIADRWVRAEHVGLELGGRRNRVADFIAANKYPGTPDGDQLALHGHEVKVTRKDWRSELRDRSKSEAIARYMHHWWLVVPDASIVKLTEPSELPEHWGLMVISSTGDLRVKIPAPRRTPDPMPLEFSLSLMASVARTAHRDPLHRDAPTVYIAQKNRCGFCGEFGPCPLHQPRFHAERAAAATPSTQRTDPPTHRPAACGVQGVP